MVWECSDVTGNAARIRKARDAASAAENPVYSRRPLLPVLVLPLKCRLLRIMATSARFFVADFLEI